MWFSYTVPVNPQPSESITQSPVYIIPSVCMHNHVYTMLPSWAAILSFMDINWQYNTMPLKKYIIFQIWNYLHLPNNIMWLTLREGNTQNSWSMLVWTDSTFWVLRKKIHCCDHRQSWLVYRSNLRNCKLYEVPVYYATNYAHHLQLAHTNLHDYQNTARKKIECYWKLNFYSEW